MPSKLPASHSRPPQAEHLPSRLFFATREQRVALARERFFEQGVRPSGLVAEPVIQSWTRCVEARRAPNETINFDPVTRSRVAQALTRQRELLQAAVADLNQLDTALAGTSCKAILTCPEGIVVHATPTARGEGRVMPLAARLGVNLNEANLGTSAPGVTARTGEVSVVHGAEHFFHGAQVMYCAAAPIRDARGQVAAVLDLSSEAEMSRFDAVALVRQYATVIENRLLEAQSLDQLLLRFQVSPALIHTPLEGLAAVTPGGHIAWFNGTGASLLGSARRPVVEADSEALFGLDVDALFALAHHGTPMAHCLPNRLTVWLQVAWRSAAASCAAGMSQRGVGELAVRAAVPTADLSRASSEDAAATAAVTNDAASSPATLGDANRTLIERVLASHHGNVSRAARELRVSRGLLYRRLKQWQPGRD